MNKYVRNTILTATLGASFTAGYFTRGSDAEQTRKQIIEELDTASHSGSQHARVPRVALQDMIHDLALHSASLHLQGQQSDSYKLIFNQLPLIQRIAREMPTPCENRATWEDWAYNNYPISNSQVRVIHELKCTPTEEIHIDTIRYPDRIPEVRKTIIKR
jgi:hypothetical protein